MNILFIDDSPFRWHKLQSRLDQNTCTWVQSADEAIAAMQDGQFDLVMIDHDLADAHYESDCDDNTTGTGIARWIVKHQDKFRRSVFVAHTLNPDGAARIQFILAQAGFHCERIPFGWEKINLNSLAKAMG